MRMRAPASTVKIDRPNNDGSTESGSTCIIISPSMRMRLIEGGDRHIHNLPTMEEVAPVIPIKYIARSFRDIVLTLRSSSRNDSLRQGHDFEQYFQRISQTHAVYMSNHYIFLFPQGSCE
ncbi:hypothetical protein RMATCC62417_09539 [Rhizopus microsporus]|nr:hypothetical protein RMATCC62417_09539 [Rhizopus microsporus]